MTIVKHGKYFNKPVIFKCKCGCEFIAQRKEYGIFHQCIDLLDDGPILNVTYARTTCPECEDLVKVEISE